MVNPAAMSYFPVASLWSILFFLMIIMLGLSTQFVTIETVITAIMDENISVFRGKRIVVLFLVCSVLFFLGLPLSTQVRDMAMLAVMLQILVLFSLINRSWESRSDTFDVFKKARGK